jgi:hypothetical protein
MHIYDISQNSSWNLECFRKVVEKIKTHVYVQYQYQSCSLWDNVGKYGRTRQATDDSIVWCMHIACCVHKTIVTHPEYVIIITCPWQRCYRKHVSLLHSYVYCLSCHCPVYTCACTRACAHTHTHTQKHGLSNFECQCCRMHGLVMDVQHGTWWRGPLSM